jgi:pyrroloquinoline quinone biosynthesis protein B
VSPLVFSGMQVVLLGTAAGGGFPQWNCWCPSCRAARRDPAQAHPRTQSSAAVSADGERWFLLNASPDVREQLGRLNGHEPAGVRHVPVEGILATDAELDHTLGLALLREAGLLQVYATPAVLEVLREDSRILPVTGAFAELRLTPLELGQATTLCRRDGAPTTLAVTPFAVPGDPPRFARRDLPGHTTGVLVHDQRTGGTLAFVPGCGSLDGEILNRLAAVDLLLFDGTFWTDQELVALKVSQRTARQMDHLPISGPGGSLEQLSRLRRPRRVYTHINNSNPMLLEQSEERRAVESAGMVVGDDGMRFEI